MSAALAKLPPVGAPGWRKARLAARDLAAAASTTVFVGDDDVAMAGTSGSALGGAAAAAGGGVAPINADLEALVAGMAEFADNEDAGVAREAAAAREAALALAAFTALFRGLVVFLSREVRLPARPHLRPPTRLRVCPRAPTCCYGGDSMQCSTRAAACSRRTAACASAAATRFVTPHAPACPPVAGAARHL